MKLRPLGPSGGVSDDSVPRASMRTAEAPSLTVPTSGSARDLDVEVALFQGRELTEQAFPYVFVDTTRTARPASVGGWSPSGGDRYRVQCGEQVRPVGLAFGLGVVVLGLQRRAERDAGLEERAGLTDRVEGAFELGWAGAAAVAEQAVVFAAQPGHLGSDRISA